MKYTLKNINGITYMVSYKGIGNEYHYVNTNRSYHRWYLRNLKRDGVLCAVEDKEFVEYYQKLKI